MLLRMKDTYSAACASFCHCWLDPAIHDDVWQSLPYRNVPDLYDMDQTNQP